MKNVKNYLTTAQKTLVYAIVILALALFTVYLGFMTQYYILFYDGTFEMFEYYKELQVFNKEAFTIAVVYVALAVLLIAFALHKYRPGLAGLVVVLGSAAYMIASSFDLMNVLPKYRANYLAMDFSSMEEYSPTTLAFDAATALHSALIGVLIIFIIVAFAAFVQRLREGNPIIRKAVTA